jgi:hypothetical protein
MVSGINGVFVAVVMGLFTGVMALFIGVYTLTVMPYSLLLRCLCYLNG